MIVPVSGSTHRAGASEGKGARVLEGDAAADLKGTDQVASPEIDTRPVL